MAYHQIPITTYQLIKSKIYFGIRLSVWNIIHFGKKKKKKKKKNITHGQI